MSDRSRKGIADAATDVHGSRGCEADNLQHFNYSPKPRRSNAMSNLQNNDNPSTPSARKMTDIIDVHSHIITNLGSQAPMDKLPPWSIEQSLSLMDANGISASVLSLPDSASHAKGPEACQLARRINEQLAEIVSKHPTRFGAMATLPALAATDGVLEEMVYALDTLKLDGGATTTSTDDIYLGATRLRPMVGRDEPPRRHLVCPPSPS